MKMTIYFTLFHYQLQWVVIINCQLLNQFLLSLLINPSMNKIKIDFFIMPKIGKEDKSARFIIHDLIVIKYI